MKCRKCGADLPVDSTLCPNCKTEHADIEAWVEAARAGDQDAIANLYNHTYNAVYQTIKAMIRDEDTVLDILQDSYVKGFQNLDQLQNSGQFRAWIKQIAANTAKNHMKKKKPILFSELENEDGEMTVDFEDDRTENLPEAVLDRKETTRLVNEILNTLSEDQRLCVGMFYYEQMSVREIAEIMGCSENTVKSRLNYARQKIKTAVEDLEKKGTKLYSLAGLPFLLWLFKGMRTQAADIPTAGILQSIQAQTASTAATATTASTAAAATAAESSATATAATGAAKATTVAAKTAAGAAGKGIALKVIAAVTAVAVVGGTAATVAILNKSDKEATTTAQTTDTRAVTDAIAGVETTAPGTQTTPPTGSPTEPQPDTKEQITAEQAYQAILDEYIAASKLYGPEYISFANSYEADYPNVNQEAMSAYHAGTDNLYYRYTDIDQDGTDELFIGRKNQYFAATETEVVDLFDFDGEKAVRSEAQSDYDEDFYQSGWETLLSPESARAKFDSAVGQYNHRVYKDAYFLTVRADLQAADDGSYILAITAEAEPGYDGGAADFVDTLSGSYRLVLQDGSLSGGNFDVDQPAENILRIINVDEGFGDLAGLYFDADDNGRIDFESHVGSYYCEKNDITITLYGEMTYSVYLGKFPYDEDFTIYTANDLHLLAGGIGLIDYSSDSLVLIPKEGGLLVISAGLDPEAEVFVGYYRIPSTAVEESTPQTAEEEVPSLEEGETFPNWPVEEPLPVTEPTTSEGLDYMRAFTYEDGEVTYYYMVVGIGSCKDSDIVIPATYNGLPVTEIWPYAFSGCENITSVTIPDGVTVIGEWAFEDCKGMTSITIPDSVTEFGESAFYGCTGLSTIRFTGTMAEWNAIEKDAYWQIDISHCTIHCADGDITGE